MNAATRGTKGNVSAPVLYMALELTVFQNPSQVNDRLGSNCDTRLSALRKSNYSLPGD